MIKINLLPPGTRRKSKAAMQMNVPWLKIICLAVLLVALYSVWIAVFTQIHSGRLSRLTSQWDKLKADRSRVEVTEAALRAFQNRTVMLKSIKAPESLWSAKLNILSDALVAKLWFTSLEFKPAEPVSDEGKAGSGKKKVKRRRSAEHGDSAEKAEKAGKSEKGSSGKASAKADKKKRISRRGKEMTEGAPPPPALVLKGAAFVGSESEGTALNRYIERVEKHPQFGLCFKGMKLKMVEHREIQKEEISDFVIELFLKKGS